MTYEVSTHFKLANVQNHIEMALSTQLHADP